MEHQNEKDKFTFMKSAGKTFFTFAVFNSLLFLLNSGQENQLVILIALKNFVLGYLTYFKGQQLSDWQIPLPFGNSFRPIDETAENTLKYFQKSRVNPVGLGTLWALINNIFLVPPPFFIPIVSRANKQSPDLFELISAMFK